MARIGMARYLVRFDDICPTMNWSLWAPVEEILRSAGIRPILSVIPDNRDPRLHFDAPNPRFWDRVREWQSLGYAIGLHGYQHQYTSRCGGIVGVKDASEFADIPLWEQRRKLTAAAEIFRREGVRPRIWVAPGHSFDRVTLTLLGDIGVSCVSDGLFVTPRRDSYNVLWIPQQLWRFRRMPLGVWTVCLHHNRWKQPHIDRFGADVHRFRRSIRSLDEILEACRPAPRGRVDGPTPRLLRALIRSRLPATAAGNSTEFI